MNHVLLPTSSRAGLPLQPEPNCRDAALRPGEDSLPGVAAGRAGPRTGPGSKLHMLCRAGGAGGQAWRAGEGLGAGGGPGPGRAAGPQLGVPPQGTCPLESGPPGLAVLLPHQRTPAQDRIS